MVKKVALAGLVYCFSILTFAQSNEASSMSSSGTSAAATSTSPPQEPAGYYYFCESLKGYYPSVPHCPEAWVAVPVAAPPPYPGRTWRTTFESEDPDLVRNNQNVLSIEVFGKALDYSFNYDTKVSEHVNLGFGLSTWSDSDYLTGYSATIAVLPLYANFYYTEKPGRAFWTCGADFIKVWPSGYDHTTFRNSGVAGLLGGGYESRDSSGLLLRFAGYVIAGRSVLINPSFSIGFAF